MTELFTRLIDWLWLRAFEPLLGRADRWDVIFLVALTAGICYWWWYWDDYCSLNEWLLWGGLLALITSMWLLARINTRKIRQRSILILPTALERTDQQIRKAKIRLILIKSALIIALLAGWFYAAYTIYRLPTFPEGTTGIYIACFGGDRSGEYQAKLTQNIQDIIANNYLENISVKAIPYKIKENNELRAREIGQRGRATLVTWGEISGPQKVRFHLTAVNAEGISETGKLLGAYSGFQDKKENFYELPLKLETLQRATAFFLTGYSYYHLQQYTKSLSYFKEAKKQLAVVATGDQDDLLLLKAIQGSVDYYIGNALYHINEMNSARPAQPAEQDDVIRQIIEHYESAIKLTEHPIERRPLFIEPLNNLGFLYITKKKELSRAAQYLQQAAALCEANGTGRAMLCARVNYNLGEAQRRQLNYQEAINSFNSALKKVAADGEDRMREENLSFLASLHQNLAFAYVKMADKLGGEAGKELYDQAEQQLEQAKASLDKVTGEYAQLLLIYNDITWARIYIGRERWDDAVRTLEAVSKRYKGPDVYLLLSIAHECGGNQRAAEEAFSVYSKRASEAGQDEDTKLQEDLDYEIAVTSRCK